jgi:hypothetical protein
MDTWARVSTHLVLHPDLDLVCGGTRSVGHQHLAHRWLEVTPELLRYVVSLGKFVLPIFVIVSSSWLVFVTT